MYNIPEDIPLRARVVGEVRGDGSVVVTHLPEESAAMLAGQYPNAHFFLLQFTTDVRDF